jgi:hypothetical protein
MIRLFLIWMKTIISIPLALLILFTGINVNIASHYCGGNLSAVKVSLNGELASCGMEQQSGEKPAEDLFSRHCCDDVISSFSISTNYVPAPFCFIMFAGLEINHTFITQDQLFISLPVHANVFSGSRRPPGGFSSSDVEQQVICIFQI